METNTKARKQPRGFTMVTMFPYRRDGFCRCGCGARARRVWASEACADKCVETYRIRKGDSNAIRTALFRRDQGKCCACGMDTEAERIQCLGAGWQGFVWCAVKRRLVEGDMTPEARVALNQKRAKHMAAGFPSPSKTWWEADHILPVAHGGGGCDLDNFQTLCSACHRGKTRLQARQKAQNRRHRCKIENHEMTAREPCHHPGILAVVSGEKSELRK